MKNLYSFLIESRGRKNIENIIILIFALKIYIYVRKTPSEVSFKLPAQQRNKIVVAIRRIKNKGDTIWI